MKRIKKGKSKKLSSRSTANKLNLKPEEYIRQKARALPISEYLINKEYRESGLAQVVVVREHKGGNITGGAYLIDLFCKGLKNTLFFFRQPSYYVDDWFENFGIRSIAISEEEALKIIYQGLSFGQELGFPPHKDFSKVTEYLLPHIDIDDEERWMEIMDDSVPKGKNGVVTLVVNPGYDPHREIAILNKTVGEEYYDIDYGYGGR